MDRSRRSLLRAGLIGVPALALGAGATRSRARQDAGIADHFPADVAVDWFETLYEIVKREANSPVVAARNYAIAAVALYESIVAGAPRALPLAGQLNSLPAARGTVNAGIHWPAAASAAMAHVIRGLYPAPAAASAAAIAALESGFANDFAALVAPARYARSVAHGQGVATRVLEWSQGDGYSTFAGCPYQPGTGPEAWQPTPPGNIASPLQPCWGSLRPMALRSLDEFAPPGPPPFSPDDSSAFYAAAREVYDVGLALTPEQGAIATHWADNPGVTGTPAGHWIALVGQFIREDGLSLAAAAEAYARLAIATNDAFICCWRTKYIYNLLRPVTYIQRYIDSEWPPSGITPPFPSYTSGHSTQSGAAAAALTPMLGVRAFTDMTHVRHGTVGAPPPRSFASLAAAAAEAARSRLYGGIHYAFDNDDGLAVGQRVGRAVLDLVRFARAGA